MNSTQCLWAFGITFVFFILFAQQVYRAYSLGLDTYYELHFKRTYIAAQTSSYSEFRKYLFWLWFFTVATGIASAVLAAVYIKLFLP